MNREAVLEAAAVLFDLDGVLVNSRVPVERQWRRWAAEHGIHAFELLKVAHGHRTIETIQRFAPELDAEAEAGEMERREIADKDGLVAMPGAAELLASISPERWAIATSGGRKLATERLRHLRLPAPRVVVTADDVVRGKPDPEPYLKAAHGLGMAPVQCIVIEDAPYGITAAHRGGMKAIAVATTYPREQLGEADLVVSNIGAITAQMTPQGVRLTCQLAQAAVRQ